MFCHNCGANLPDGTGVCNVCGTAQLPHKKNNPNLPAASGAGSQLPAPGQPVNPYFNQMPNQGRPNGPGPGTGHPNGPRPYQGQPNGPGPQMPYGHTPQPGSGQPSSNGSGTLPPPPRGTVALSTNRSAIVAIILTALTCGIYNYYFVYKMAKDINTVCAGDGKLEVGGLGQYILFSFLTCGIYSVCWQYSLQERMRLNSSRYGIYIQNTGLSVLLYQTIGISFCGLGPFFSLHALTSSANALCEAYNHYNHL